MYAAAGANARACSRRGRSLILPLRPLAWPAVTIRLGHSHEADDVFLFHALTAGKVDTGDLQIEPVVLDFQGLNDKASRGELEATTLSVHAYAYARKHYRLLRSGWTFGEGRGPMIVAREAMTAETLAAASIAVGGVTSSAYLAMTLWNPRARTRVLPFDKVLPAVETGLVDAGLMVHEEEMALELTGLVCVHDLGEWWSGKTDGLPLPLGSVVVRRDLDEDVQRQLHKAVSESVHYALANRQEVVTAVRGTVGGLEADLADDFLGRYITDLSLDIGDRGQSAAEEFLRRGCETGIIPDSLPLEFAPSAAAEPSSSARDGARS
ncbi:MAG TPA: ABC transporter substrate-binding protein [Phycisphaerae bacterium]|nr:ABC transporter substrate-binding protein [Phycisphaerae bacterium]